LSLRYRGGHISYDIVHEHTSRACSAHIPQRRRLRLIDVTRHAHRPWLPLPHIPCGRPIMQRIGSLGGNWTTRGYANSRIANSRTGHLADWSTCGLDNSRTSQLADWTSRGLDNSRSRKTKHAKSPMASASCPVRDLSSQTIGLYCSYYRDTTPNRPCVKCRSKM